MKRKGWDDQMRGLQTIDQVHVHSGWMKRMVRIKVFKQLANFTYELETE